jgi:streptogramin lyase
MDMRRVRTIGLCFFAVVVFASVTPVLAAGCPNGVCAQGAVGSSIGAFSEFPIPTAKSEPGRLTVGPDGNLWFIEQAAGKIGRVTPSGAISDFLIPGAGGTESPALAAGADGNVWFESGVVGRITPSGAVTEFPQAVGTALAAGPNGNIWFAGGPGIGWITPAGMTGQVTVSKGGSNGSTSWGPSSVAGLTVGPDGNVWFTLPGTSSEGGGPGGIGPLRNEIGRITPSGTVTKFPITTARGGAETITAGSDGNVWFTAERRIGRVTPNGSITTFRIPIIEKGERVQGGVGSVAGEGRGLIRGPDGNLWFGLLGGWIGRVTPGGMIREFPTFMFSATPTAGPDGNLWLIGRNAIREGARLPTQVELAKITPSGSFSRYPIPTRLSPTGEMTVGPDGNFWFPLATNEIGRIDYRVLPPPGPPRRCVVPNLRGKTLRTAEKLLGRANCLLDGYTKYKKKRVVVSQKPAAKKSLPYGAKVVLGLD